MILKEKSSIQWLEFECFQQFPQLKHGIFLKNHHFNLSYLVGDSLENVQGNENAIRQLLEIPQLFRADLCHGNGVQIAPSMTPCDALVTNKAQEGLLITHADCQAAIIYDPKHHVVANVHCGWRGNVQNIYANTVAFLRNFFLSQPQDLFVGISPSLGPEHAEFIHYQNELPHEFHSYQTKPFHFDFWAISQKQLTDLGIPLSQIEIAQECTFSSPQKFYSYRRGKKCGRNATVVMLER